MDVPKQAPQLNPGDFSEAEFRSTRYVADIEIGVSVDAMCVPAFWAHHAHRLRPWDRIEARAKDGTWLAELLVLDCSRTWAKVKVMSRTELTTADVSLSQASDNEISSTADGYEIKHRGPRLWSVIRKADRIVVLEDQHNREDAEAWLKAHVEQEVKGKRTAAV